MISIHKRVLPLLLFVAGVVLLPMAGRAADDDGDGVESAVDNCPLLANSDQADLDRDSRGDLCDDDRDGDGLTEVFETEVLGTDPADWDTDGDSISDFYDCEPLDPENSLGTDCDRILSPTSPPPITPGGSLEPNADEDGDGVTNGADNCVFVFNPGQQDMDGDGIGDQCDSATAVSIIAGTPPNGVVSGGQCALLSGVSASKDFSWALLFLFLIRLRRLSHRSRN